MDNTTAVEAKAKTKIAEQQLRTFVSKGAEGCPFCGPDQEIGPIGTTSFDGRQAEQRLTCPDCAAEWIAVYRLTDVQPLTFQAATPWISLGLYGICLFKGDTPDEITISSQLRQAYRGGDCQGEFNDRMATLETVILSAVKAGIDVGTGEFAKVIKDTVEAYRDEN